MSVPSAEMSPRSLRNIEVLLLLPATCFLLPLLVAGAFGSLIALITIASESSTPFRHRLFGMILPATIVCWVGAAALGMLAAWIVVFEQTMDSLSYSRRQRYAYLVCLFLGEIAGMGWLFVMFTQQRGNNAGSWAVWLALLVGPLVVGLHHSFRLLRNPGRAEPNTAPEIEHSL
jgi:hypothetical protein